MQAEPVLMPLDTLVAGLAPYNPNAMTEFQAGRLEASIERFGVVQGIVWNERTKTVVGGHQTIAAAVKRGDVAQLWAFPVDLDVRHEKALNLALNRIHGEWDWTKVADIVRELDAWEGDLLDLTGFPEWEVQPLLSDGYTPVSPRDDAQGEGGSVSIKDPTQVVLALNEEQARPFAKAVEKIRAREGHDSMAKAECLRIICQEWLKRS